MIAHHPDSSHVANGDVYWEFAEALFAFREVEEALDYYQKLQEEFKEHAKDVESAGVSQVGYQVRECSNLHRRMENLRGRR